MLQAGFTLDDVPGRINWRALWSFVTHTPKDSALWNVINPQAWSRQEHLMAGVFDAVRELTWIFQCAQTTRSRWPARPKQFPRPGVDNDVDNYGAVPIDADDFDDFWKSGA